MNEAKIRLSKKETELIASSDWILTKNAILEKVNLLLENIVKEQQKILHSFKSVIPAEVTAISPKISKGENYNGLPWRILDYPRLFKQEHVFAIRCMFWWGNFFSVTLHLSGIYKKQSESSLAASFPKLKKERIYCCINDDQWQHHFEKDNYTSLYNWSENDYKTFVNRKAFIKLAKRIPLEQWDDAPEKLLNSFRLFIGVITGKN